jgi:hypothetical protein
MNHALDEALISDLPLNFPVGFILDFYVELLE